MKQSKEILGKLSEQGYRLTPQRMMILSAIENGDGHISAEEIYAQVTAKHLNRLPHLGITQATGAGNRDRPWGWSAQISSG